jgi:hypothetical protein
VLSNRESLLAPFLAQGFQEGFEPPVELRSYPSSLFLRFLLTVFGEGR